MAAWNFQKVTKVEPKDNYKIYVEFDDGNNGIVDLSDNLWGEVFEPLKDPEFFKQVTLDDWGAPCWPNGADIAPDKLYEQLS